MKSYVGVSPFFPTRTGEKEDVSANMPRNSQCQTDMYRNAKQLARLWRKMKALLGERPHAAVGKQEHDCSPRSMPPQTTMRAKEEEEEDRYPAI